MVPVSSLIVMALCALLGVAVPVGLAIWLVKKYQVKPLTILVGAGVFIVFALVLEPILHQLVLKGPHGAAILGNVWYYALYGGLAAGLFEETGRFLGMKFLLKKEPSAPITGVAYGMGHGGAEMLLIYGLSMFSSIAFSVMINTGQADTLLATVPAEGLAQVQAQLDQLQTAAPGSYLLGIWERVSALLLQLALSLMVWTAVRRGGKWLWLFPAAILLHFVVDATAAVLVKTVSMPLVETVLMCMAVALGAAAWMLARKR
jgi:uncharacterized membrane protein YhfC